MIVKMTKCEDNIGYIRVISVSPNNKFSYTTKMLAIFSINKNLILLFCFEIFKF